MTDLEKAIDILKKENHTIVLCKEDEIVTSDDMGIKALVNLIDSGKDFSEFSVCGKIVGRAASFLYVLMGVSAVHGEVMAKLAPQILDRAEIKYSADTFVETIMNQDKTGLCKFEEAVIRSGSAVKAFEDIKKLL